MNSISLYFANKIIRLLPETRCFSFKRWLLRRAGANIGQNVRICSSTFITGTGHLSIGDNTWVGHKTVIVCSREINIGANIDIAPMVYIGDGSHIISPNGSHIAGEGISRSITIEDGAWLCAGARLLPGITVGSKSVVGAGAVVNKSIPANTIYAGVPAKFIRNV